MDAEIWKLIRTEGEFAPGVGYLINGMYRVEPTWNVMKRFGFRYIWDRLNGRYWWWVKPGYYDDAMNQLHELQKTHKFTIQVAFYE